MKNFILLLTSVLFVLTIFSCKDNKTKFQKMEDFRSTLTSEDTTQMLKICDDCMTLLKAKKIDEALSSIYSYDMEKNEVNKLDDSERKRLAHMFKVFPVLDYRRDYYSFQLEGENDVKYVITFAEADEGNDLPAAQTALMFNPVKLDDTWYLCIKTKDEDFDHLKN